jgi:hypothetical protein
MSFVGFGKRGSSVESFALQGIMIVLVFVGLLMAVNERVSARDVRIQVLEKQLALLIDSSEAGFSFEVAKINVKGLVDRVWVENGKIYAKVNGLYGGGYSYFSRYAVWVEEREDKFVVRVG